MRVVAAGGEGAVSAVLSLDCTGTLFRIKGNNLGQHYLSAVKTLAPRWRRILHSRPPTSSCSTEEEDEEEEELLSRKVQKAFGESYKRHCKTQPVFGRTHNLSSRDWWEKVVSQTFSSLLLPPSSSSSPSPFSSSSSPSPSSSSPLSPLRTEEELRSSEEFQRVFESLFRSFGTKECWEVFPDALQLLQTAQPLRTNQTLRIVLISNFDERLHGLLSELGVRGLVDEVVTSREMGVEKPDPTIFSLALQRLGLHPPERYAPLALHVGDHLQNDYHAPRDFDMQSKLLVRDKTELGKLGSLGSVPPTDIISSLSDITLTTDGDGRIRFVFNRRRVG